MNIQRGDIIYVDLHDSVGMEQHGVRPALVIQNNVGNKYSKTTIIAPITSKRKKLPTHVPISCEYNGLWHNSTVLLEQIRVIDESRIGDCLGNVPKIYMKEIDKAIKISLAL